MTIRRIVRACQMNRRGLLKQDTQKVSSCNEPAGWGEDGNRTRAIRLVKQLQRPRCPIPAAVVYPCLSSRTNREQATLLDSARCALRFAFSFRALRTAL